MKLLILIFLIRFQKLILISLHVIYIILSPWNEIRPLSLTSNPPYKCLRNYILPPPPLTLRFGLSSGPPINLNPPPPPPDNYCTVPYLHYVLLYKSRNIEKTILPIQSDNRKTIKDYQWEKNIYRKRNGFTVFVP